MYSIIFSVPRLARHASTGVRITTCRDALQCLHSSTAVVQTCKVPAIFRANCIEALWTPDRQILHLSRPPPAQMLPSRMHPTSPSLQPPTTETFLALYLLPLLRSPLPHRPIPSTQLAHTPPLALHPPPHLPSPPPTNLFPPHIYLFPTAS